MCKGCAGLKAKLRENTGLMAAELNTERGKTARVTEDRDHMEWAFREVFTAITGFTDDLGHMKLEQAVTVALDGLAARTAAVLTLNNLGYVYRSGHVWEAIGGAEGDEPFIDDADGAAVFTQQVLPHFDVPPEGLTGWGQEREITFEEFVETYGSRDLDRRRAAFREAVVAGMDMAPATRASLADRDKPHLWSRGGIWFCIDVTDSTTGCGTSMEAAYHSMLATQAAIMRAAS